MLQSPLEPDAPPNRAVQTARRQSAKSPTWRPSPPQAEVNLPPSSARPREGTRCPRAPIRRRGSGLRRRRVTGGWRGGRGACAVGLSRLRSPAVTMMWFGGSIPAAIAAAKQQSSVFVVFVSGTVRSERGGGAERRVSASPALTRRPRPPRCRARPGPALRAASGGQSCGAGPVPSGWGRCAEPSRA